MGVIRLRNYPNKELKFTFPNVERREYTGFIGKDNEKVKIEKTDSKLLRQTNNASEDLIELIDAINNSGSPIAVNQILKTSNNLSKIHIKIEHKLVEPINLLGLHQPHDKNGNILNWIDGKLDGVPAYVEGKKGIYKEVTITIYKENIKESKRTNGGYGNAWVKMKIKLSLEQVIASNFSHESNHNTDAEFIEDYRNKIEGKEAYKGIDPHLNIHPQERNTWMEMLFYNTTNKK